MKTCTLCTRDLPLDCFVKDKCQKDGLKTRCKSCTRVMDARWREKNPEAKRLADKRYRETHPERIKKNNREWQRNWYKQNYARLKIKEKVRLRTRYLVKKGVLVKGPCSICGKVKVEAHHTDYEKPEQVMWLCRRHHLMEHSKERSARNVVQSGAA